MKLKKFVLALGAVALAISVAGGVGFYAIGGVDGLQQDVVKRFVASQRTDLFEDGRMHVFTLGTGSPQLGTGRMPPANAVVAGDELIMIDAGEGASRTLGDLNVPIQRLTAIFLTHWHSDHVAGVGQMLNQSWNADRHHEVLLFGPKGVEEFMEGVRLQYAEDIRYRSVGHVEHNDPAFAFATPVLVELGEEPIKTVFDRNGLVVKAFLVDHGHVKPAFGYRVEYKGKVVVFSGDTVATPLIVGPARGADMLVHEAMCKRMVQNAATALDEIGVPVEADRARAIMVYHADTIGVAKYAEDAGVKMLVLSHLIPGPPNAIAKRMFTSGMSEHFTGVIRVAEDGEEFDL